MSLRSNIKDAFDAMADGGDNSDFAEGIAKAVADYISTLSVTTTDAGTVSVGVFAGSGSGSLEVDDSKCSTPLLEACEAMNNMTEGGNAYLAGKIASTIDTMVSAGKVKTKVSGSVTLPNGAQKPVTGAEAEGTISCVASTIEEGLVSCFSTMDNMSDGGDDYLAGQLASLVTSYLSAGVVNTQGKGDISGAVGVGALA